jgi:hypothetical protein
MIHKDLKVSNILCPQLTKRVLQAIKLTCSRNFPMEIFCACDRFVLAIGEYESMDGVVGTAFLESTCKCWTPWERTSHQRIHQQRMCTLLGWYVMSYALVKFLLKAIAWQIMNWHCQAEDESCLITWALGWPNHWASAGKWIVPYCLDGASSDQS